MAKAISTADAPPAIGPYSQAIEINDMVFCSGQVGVDPVTKKLADGIEALGRRRRHGRLQLSRPFRCPAH